MKKTGIIVLTISLLILAILIAGCGETAGEATKITCTDTDGGLNYAVKGTATGRGVSKTDVCVSTIQLKESSCKPTGVTFWKTIRCEVELGAGFSCFDGACIPPPIAEDVTGSEEELAAPVCTPRNYSVCNETNMINVTLYSNCSTENRTTICTYGCLDYPGGAMCREEPRTTADVGKSCTELSTYTCVNATHLLNVTTNVTCGVTEQNVSCTVLGLKRCDTVTNWCV